MYLFISIRLCRTRSHLLYGLLYLGACILPLANVLLVHAFVCLCMCLCTCVQCNDAKEQWLTMDVRDLVTDFCEWAEVSGT